MRNKFNPIFDRVLVICEQTTSSSDGGIIFADTENHVHLHPTRNARVIAVGPGKISTKGTNIPMSVKVGDRIQINGVAGVSISGKEGKYVKQDETLITESDIYFIYEESK